MGYKERKDFYSKLESARESRVICYFTGDRSNLEAKIGADVIDRFVEHLDRMDGEKISLILYTRGGDTLAAWNLANLIRQFCKQFEVIVPNKCHSAGTLISLAANTIVMTKQATLGPIDPSIDHPLNPSPIGYPPQARVPVSVEAVSGFFELAKSIGGETEVMKGDTFRILAGQLHPLVLGQAYRTRTQIRMLGEQLLNTHLNNAEKVNKILSFLCSDSGSHDYTVNRKEAKDKLGLNIEKPNDELYNLIKGHYDDAAAELELLSIYDPKILLGSQNSKQYRHVRAIIESVESGSHQFSSEGQLKKESQTTQVNNQVLKQVFVSDERSFEGWKHCE